MFVRPLSVAAIGALGLAAAVLFGVSGCDQLHEWAEDFVDHGAVHPGSGGLPDPTKACTSSESCPGGQVCSTELGACELPPACKADPNAICPAVCYGVCQPKAEGEACGKVTCGAGQVCCNASCGICTPPNGGCVALACDVPPPPEVDCTTDADCHLAADYCSGCDCRALGSKVGLPACPNTPVACFADPCMQKTAVCVNGQCSVAAAPTR